VTTGEYVVTGGETTGEYVVTMGEYVTICAIPVEVIAPPRIAKAAKSLVSIRVSPRDDIGTPGTNSSNNRIPSRITAAKTSYNHPPFQEQNAPGVPKKNAR
jgi:hypothetical protein